MHRALLDARREALSTLGPRPQRLVSALVAAFLEGGFPMAEGRRAAGFSVFTADPRSIIPLLPDDPGSFHVATSLQRRVRSGRFVITTDRAFERVISACADQPRSTTPDPDDDPSDDADDATPSTWINDQIISAYALLHRLGLAHSIEAWLVSPSNTSDPDAPVPNAQLVGGLYGVQLGRAFLGESMFSRPALGGTDASKVCLVHLVHHLRRRAFTLLDTQFANNHMRRFGLIEIRHAQYLRRLHHAIASDPAAAWLPFNPDLTIQDLRTPTAS